MVDAVNGVTFLRCDLEADRIARGVFRAASSDDGAGRLRVAVRAVALVQATLVVTIILGGLETERIAKVVLGAARPDGIARNLRAGDATALVNAVLVLSLLRRQFNTDRPEIGIVNAAGPDLGLATIGGHLAIDQQPHP